MIHLVIGGARSGKSRFAENLVADQSDNKIYIATATAADDEMQKRITHHQKTRANDWQLIEEPLYLSPIIHKQSNSKQVLLIECMTLWLSNWLCSDAPENWHQEKQLFLKTLVESKATIIIVTNEVGTGIVPLGELSRDFVDQSGWLNQQLARLANKVTLIVAGLPIELKPNSLTE